MESRGASTSQTDLSEGKRSTKVSAQRYISDGFLNDSLMVLPACGLGPFRERVDAAPGDFNSVKVPTEDQVNAMRRPWFPPLGRCEPSRLVFDLHSNSKEALMKVKGGGGRFLRIIIHVDGTGGSVVPGSNCVPAVWSFNVVGEHTGGLEYLGFRGGSVATSPEADDYIGAERGTNSTAELTVIAFACMFVVQAKIEHVLIVYDAMYAANMATATWTPGTNKEFVDTVTELVGVIEHVAVLEREHVYSHTGDAWNEWADAGATAYSLVRLVAKYQLPAILAEQECTQVLPWGSLHLLPPDQRTQYPPFLADVVCRQLVTTLHHSSVYCLE